MGHRVDGGAHTLLVTALAFSWLGDGAGTFLPFLPELPAMLLCFGIAHVLYIVLFWRMLAVRRLPAWAAVYALWWVLLLVLLWPHLSASRSPSPSTGSSSAAPRPSATRCHPAIVVGAASFLASDTTLAFWIFLRDSVPDWFSPLVMLT